jgi:uncharacterized membrane protein
MQLVVGFYAFVGLLLAGLAIPLMRKVVPPNRWYGFRIPLTLQDRQTWYAVNAWAGRRLLILGGATTISALLALLLPNAWLPVYVLGLGAFLLAGVLLILALGIRYARSL